ncbi:MAG TPA: hypothetical protein VK444_01060 [Methanobacteriaceae archaeon]|nr:hypothetical protein [Methanobacteriaceae archaeon]
MIEYIKSIYEDNRFTINHDRIIYFFALFNLDIGSEFGNNFLRVGVVITKTKRMKGSTKVVFVASSVITISNFSDINIQNTTDVGREIVKVEKELNHNRSS